MAYDQSRNINGYHNNESQIHKTTSHANGVYEISHTTKSSKRARKSNAAATAPSNLNTFWTSCNKCRMQYEYLRVYLNQNLLCPNCHQAFLAIEIGVPASVVNSSASWSNKPSANHITTKNGHSTSTFQGTGTVDFQQGENFTSYTTTQNLQWGANSGARVTGGTADSSLQAANKIQRKLEKLRRKQEKAQDASKSAYVFGNNYNTSNNFVYDYGTMDHNKNGHVYEHEYAISRPGRPRKRALISSENNFFYHGGDEARTFTLTGASEVERTTTLPADYPKAKVTSRQSSFNTEVSQVNIRQLLIEKVKLALSGKLGEWNLQKQEKLRIKGQIGKDSCNEYTADKVDHVQTHLHDPSMNASTCLKDIRTLHSIDVPDPDFYDFDKDRLEDSFQDDQIWATYDNEDGMPRFYASIKKVISRKPFKVLMSFLTTKCNSEFGSMNWLASGFAKTCGNFRVSRYEIVDTINIFSHRVRWEKGPRRILKILPKKGDTWALYRNWSCDWNEQTPDDVIHKYEMVEVVDDYDDECGVNVTPLVKVAGFKAVFHRHLDPNEVRQIPRDEMFRFSHQVPSYLLTGTEAHNSLKGCRELDPAATPLDLLQIITELNDAVETKTNNQQAEG